MTMRHDPIDPGQAGGVERSAFPEVPPVVADRMTRPAITIGWAEPLASAARLMAERGIRHLPVVDADRRLIGILTESDVREIVASEGLRDLDAAPSTLIVGKAMSLDPVAVTPDTSLAAAVTLMYKRKISAVPVVDADEVVGILSESDILREFTERIAGE